MSEPIKSDQEVICRLCSYVIFAWNGQQAYKEWQIAGMDPTKPPTPHWDYECAGMKACNDPTECPNCGFANEEGMEHIDNSPEERELELADEDDSGENWLGDPDAWKTAG